MALNVKSVASCSYVVISAKSYIGGSSGTIEVLDYDGTSNSNVLYTGTITFSGANGLGGEWSLNQMPLTNTPNLKSDKILDFSNRLEGYLSGKSIEKRFNEQFIY